MLGRIRAMFGRSVSRSVRPRPLGLEELESRTTPAVAETVYTGTFLPGKGPQNLATAGGKLFFTAATAADGRELWVSDGTEAGTKVVKDINMGKGDGIPPTPDGLFVGQERLVGAGGFVYFAAWTDGTAKTLKLWRSDGTAANTQEVSPADPNAVAGLNAGKDQLLVGAGGSAVFIGSVKNGAGRTTGFGLWAARDGQYSLLRTFPAGTALRNLTNVNGTVLAYAQYPNDYEGKQSELWSSDGTAAGTKLVPGSQSDRTISQLFAAGGALYYAADDGVVGRELWKVEPVGTGFRASRVADVYPGAVGSDPNNMIGLGNKVLFSAKTIVGGNQKGRELWVSDGTANGTKLVKDINAGAGDGMLSLSELGLQPTALGSKVLFIGTDGTGTQLWATDGDPANANGTVSLTAVSYSGNSALQRPWLTTFNGKGYFAKNNGAQVWETDGTAANTVEVKTAAGASVGAAYQFTAVSNTLLMFSSGNKVWKITAPPPQAPAPEIAGMVWKDDNNPDGIRDETPNTPEVGQAGVRVSLLRNGAEIAWTTTDAAGRYEFADVSAGMYQVAFAAPTGTAFTLRHQGPPDTDSDPDEATGETDEFEVTTADVTHVDAGLVSLGYGSLGGRVWDDADDDGLQDAGEDGLAGVSVQLLDPTDEVLAGTTTDADGRYAFRDLPAGPYQVRVVPSARYEFSPAGQGNGTNDGDFDGDGLAAALVADGVDVTDLDAGLHLTNVAPVGADDAYTAPHGSTFVVGSAAGVLANDTDPEGDPLTAVLVDGPAYGTVNLNADGSFTYTFTPTSGFSGTDSFTYRPVDPFGGGAPVTVTITVPNTVPVTADDTASTTENTPVTVAVLANDSDPDGDSLAVAVPARAGHGAVRLNPDKTVTYTPDAGWTGTDSFQYTVDDGFGPVTATVTVTVTPANSGPQAGDDSYTLHQGTTIDVLAPGVLVNDPKPNGFALTVTSYTQPVNVATGADITGDTLTVLTGGRMQYRAGAGFVGVARFNYTVSDGHGYTATHTVYLHVTNAPPAGDADAYAVAAGGVLQVTTAAAGVLGNDTDGDADTLRVVLVSGPIKGTLWLNTNGTFTYRPNAGQIGTDTFVYRAFDGAQYTDPITVTLTIG